MSSLITVVGGGVHTQRTQNTSAARSTPLKGGTRLACQIQRAGVEPLKGGVQNRHLLTEGVLGRGLCARLEAGARSREQARYGGPPAFRVPGQPPLALKGHLLYIFCSYHIYRYTLAVRSTPTATFAQRLSTAMHQGRPPSTNIPTPRRDSRTSRVRTCV